jgi:hypothetical protein
LRYAGIILCSALLPVAGVPMLPYACLVIFIHALVYQFARWDRLLCIGLGFLLGVFALFLFYSHFASWSEFMASVLPFTSAGKHGDSQILHKIVGVNGESLLVSFFGNPTEFLDQRILFDYSAALLFLVVILLTPTVWRAGNDADRRLLRFIILLTLLVPPAMFIAAHYRSFYRWMTYIPLAIATPRLLECCWGNIRSTLVPKLALAAITLSLLMGVPARTLAILPSWAARSPEPIERVAKQIVQPSDIVLCDFKVYFAVRPKAAALWAIGLPALGELRFAKDIPTNNISLLCVSPQSLGEAMKVVGGKWKKLTLAGPDANALSKTRYAVDFYRRDSQ